MNGRSLFRYGAACFAICLSCLLIARCGGTAGSTSASSGTPPPASSPPATQFGHLFLVLLENQDYNSVIGNPAMPFFNRLAAQNTLAINYFGNTHPSAGNYFMLTTGELVGDDTFAGTVTADNIVRELTAAGKTWKTYLQSLPNVGYVGGDVYPYVKHHNPFSYMTDVLNSPAQQQNILPVANLSSDLAGQSLANYSFIVPDQQNNAHDCPPGMTTCTNDDKLAAADRFLAANVPAILNNPVFQQDGLLIVVFDEASAADVTNGGGHVAMLLAGPKVKRGFQSSGLYQHQSTLRLSLEGLGITALPGLASGATPIQDPFTP